MGEKGLKSELDEASNWNSQLVVDNYMKHSNDDKELNFSNPLRNVVGLASRTDLDENTNTEGKTFNCNFCNKKFSSPQALGGHQNAHRHERTLAKRLQYLEQPQIPCYPYPTFSTCSLYGGSLDLDNRTLDDSVIHKPSYPWASTGFRYGHSWSGRDMGILNSSPPFDGFGIVTRDATPISPEDGKPTLTTSGRHSMPVETSKVESSNIDLELKL